MTDLLRQLTSIPAVPGSEEILREFIIKQIKDHAEYETDFLGNITVYKKGAQRAARRVILDAHMDEVGLVITYICKDGSLKFACAGGIDTRVLIGRRVIIGGGIYGVIGLTPVHLLDNEQRKTVPKTDELSIDIGAKDAEDAGKAVKIGYTAVFDSEFIRFGDRLIKARALDDRIGCAVLINMIVSPQPYDLIFSFSVQEELGCRGAKVAAERVKPDFAVVVESTTAADISGVAKDKQVCVLGAGPAVSFMDGGTVYDGALYRAAFEAAEQLGIPCQPKAAVSGGNNASAIHLAGTGVRVLSLSAPCRYLHSPVTVAHEDDILHLVSLSETMSGLIASGVY